MTIEKNKVVSVEYTLTVKNGSGEESLVEKTDKAHPFVFLFGAGGLIPAFEDNLSGKKVGDGFDFYIKAAEGYGEHDAGHVVNIPIEAFKGEDGKVNTDEVAVGKTLPMIDNQGHRLQGLVQEVNEQFVRMDFNHPLAGQDLHFTGKVIEVREATAEEISHGHVHGPGGHHH